MEFKHQHSLLLYLLSEGFKQGAIDEYEKIKIKKLILKESPAIKKAMQLFEQDGRTDKLWLNLKKLVSNEDFKDSDDISTEPEQLSSPSDTALIREKKKLSKRKYEEYEKEGVCGVVERRYEVKCKRCDLGNSPPTMKRYFNDDC
jgi:hypothetical protein